jgi:hypothetical protein
MKVAPHIDRFGYIRKMLVDYFQDVLLKRDNTLKKAFFKALREEYGDPLVVKSENSCRLTLFLSMSNFLKIF